MSQIVTVPNADGLGGLLSQRALGIALSGIGADQRYPEVENRAALKDEAYAAQEAVDLPISAEPVAIHKWQGLCLLQQFLVLHDTHPQLEGAFSATKGSHFRLLTHASRVKYFSFARTFPLDPLQIQAAASRRTSLHLPEYQFAVPSRGDNAAVASSAPKPCAAAATISTLAPATSKDGHATFAAMTESGLLRSIFGSGSPTRKPAKQGAWQLGETASNSARRA